MFLILGTFIQQGLAQFTQLSGIINEYKRVESIIALDNNDEDSVIVENLDGSWGVGDTVMIYGVKGFNIITNDADESKIGTRDEYTPSNAGKYAFFIIKEIIGPTRTVRLNTSFTPSTESIPQWYVPLAPGEVVQMIKVKSYRRAEVVGTLTAQKWDSTSGTGGVLAFFVQRTLILNDDIDVSGTGFRGAVENQTYAGDCSNDDPDLYDDWFYNTSDVLGGKKGEGTTRSNFSLLRGRARNINGGGGGNGKMSGGGGGSNFNDGGDGGSESSSCPPAVDTEGRGGQHLKPPFYINGNDQNRGDRIFFGGGGGTGTQIAGRTSTPGGDGGGVVVIIADSIIGNDHSIIADGASVTGTASAGGGGGGGGGVLALSVCNFDSSPLELSVVGGKGGDTFASDTTGPGGGGGGGFYWLACAKPPQVNPIYSTGQNGRHLSLSPISYNASVGGSPGVITGLLLPIRGFLFNTVPDEFTICSDRVPETIYGSTPRGGDGAYTYEWIDSTENHDWQPATYGTWNARDFDFNSTYLSDTTYYRRVVRSGTILPPDTSFRIAVYVHPAITGNVVMAPDTVCRNGIPEMFQPAGILYGGDTTQNPRFTYQWFSRTDGSGYTSIPGATESTFQAGELSETTYFIREVKSGVSCVSTSDSLLVKVWETLTGNVIGDPDTVCYNTAPDLLTGNRPENGDQNDIRYQWQSATDTTAGWTSVSGAESRSFQSDSLIQTTYFRRIVLSGSGDACKDTSNSVEVLNIPLITGNNISSDQTVCTNDTAAMLSGSDPGGGYLGIYSYQWESRTLSSDWGPASGMIDVKTGYEPGQMTGDTTWYRRAVGSGGSLLNVCVDYSDSAAVNVLPLITGNLITAPDTVLCQGDTLGIVTQDPAAGTAPGGGATQGGVDPTRRYQWERSFGTGQPGSWEVIPGEDQLDYSGQPVLDGEEDFFLRRVVYSGPDEQCMDMDTLRIEVHTVITGNTIEPFDSVCFADTKILSGNTPAGEQGLSPVYTWKDVDAGADIPGSDQKDLNYGPYNQLGAYHYERQVEIGACRDISNAMQITVMQLPGGRLTDDPFQACEGESELTVDLNMDHLNTYVSPWMIRFRNQEDTTEAAFVSGNGPVPVILDIDADSLVLQYEIESISYRSEENRYECVSPVDSLSGMVPVYVFRTPNPTINGSETSDDSVCGPTMTLTVDTDRGTGSWTSIPSGAVFDPGTGESEYLASIPDSHDAYGEYQLILTSVAGVCADTAVLNGRFDEQPAPPFAGNDTMVFLKNTFQLRADPPTAGTGTWTVDAASVIIEDPSDPQSMVSNLGMGEETTFIWTVSNGVCVEETDFVIVVRNEVKRYQGFSPNGDMQNEYYIMQGLAYAEEFTISFFNALGDKVRTVTNETVDELEVDEALIANGLKEDEKVVWDGRSDNGNLVPSGTYYFVIDFIYHQVDYLYKDYVVVMRD